MSKYWKRKIAVLRFTIEEIAHVLKLESVRCAVFSRHRSLDRDTLHILLLRIDKLECD